MAGQFSFGRDGDSTAHCPMPATLVSMPEENRTVILTLNAPWPSLISRFLFFQKVHSAVICPSYCSFVLTLFFCLASHVSMAMYRAEMGKQNLDMLLDILPNQDNAFRRYSSTPYLFNFYSPFELLKVLTVAMHC